MKRLFTIAVAATIAALASAPAHADYVLWEEFNVWTVVKEPGYACWIEGEFEDGSYLEIGYDLEVDEGYLTVLNEELTEIVEDEEYELEIMLDSELWEATAVGVVYDGYPGVEVSTDNREFLVGLADKNVLSFLDDEGHPYSFSLAGTAVALESTWECIESML